MKKIFSLSILIGISALYRALVFTKLNHLDLINNQAWLKYYDGLRNHLLEYVLYNIQKVPLPKIILGAIYKSFSVADLNAYHLELVFGGIFTIAGACFLFLAMEKISSRWIALSISILYSIALSTWEVRWGAEYVVSGMMIICLFIYATILALTKPQNKTFVFFIFSGLLLISQFEIQLTIVPLVIVFVSIFSLKAPFRIRSLFRKICFALFPVILLCSVFILKTYFAVGTLNNGSLGGGHLMRNIIYWMGDDITKYTNEMKRIGVPDWYQWCYDNAELYTLKKGEKAETPFPPSTLMISKTTGSCFNTRDISDRCWPFDYSPLKNYLQGKNLPDLEAVLAKDEQRSCNQNFLFLGNAWEAGSLWNGVYSKVSYTVAKKLILERFNDYLLFGMKRIFLFALGGPNGFLIAHDVAVNNNPKLSDLPFGLLVRAFVAVNRYFLFLILPLFALSLGIFIISFSKIKPTSTIRVNSPLWIKIQCVMILQILIATLLFNYVTCCEWSRLYEQIVPFMMVLLAGWIEVGRQFVKRDFGS